MLELNQKTNHLAFSFMGGFVHPVQFKAQGFFAVLHSKDSPAKLSYWGVNKIL